MSRCIVNYKERYCNLQADRMEERDGILFVYNGQILVGTFDLGTIDNCYLTKETEKP